MTKVNNIMLETKRAVIKKIFFCPFCILIILRLAAHLNLCSYFSVFYFFNYITVIPMREKLEFCKCCKLFYCIVLFLHTQPKYSSMNFQSVHFDAIILLCLMVNVMRDM